MSFQIKKLISTSKPRAEHPFAGRNTQQLRLKVEILSLITVGWSKYKTNLLFLHFV